MGLKLNLVEMKEDWQLKIRFARYYLNLPSPRGQLGVCFEDCIVCIFPVPVIDPLHGLSFSPMVFVDPMETRKNIATWWNSEH